MQIQRLYDLLVLGGWAMVPIYACSVLGFGVFVHKLVELHFVTRERGRWLPPIVDHVRAQDWAAAEAGCKIVAHPAARVVEAVVSMQHERPDRAPDEAKRVAALEIHRLEKNLGVLSLLAQVSPLLGLLGTVLGMVELFMALEGTGQGNLAMSALSSGIWKALLTTAAGLSVAVPCLAAHAYLASRIDTVRLQMADIVQRVAVWLPNPAK